MAALRACFEAIREYNEGIRNLNSDPSRPDYEEKVKKLSEETMEKVRKAVGNVCRVCDAKEASSIPKGK